MNLMFCERLHEKEKTELQTKIKFKAHQQLGFTPGKF